MGYIVENPVTIAALRKQLKVLDSRVDVFHGTKLKKLTLPDSKRNMVGKPFLLNYLQGFDCLCVVWQAKV